MEEEILVQEENIEEIIEITEEKITIGMQPQGEINITENGEYDVTNYSEANVEVEGIVPTGVIQITSNGIKNVTNYESANVNVLPNLQNKNITIEENTTINVEPDEGYEGLSSIEITTNVPTSKQKYRLPDNYQEVEYIQGTGTQYIDTTFLANGGMKAEYEVEYSSDIITINGGYIVGSHNTRNPYARNGGYYNNNVNIKGWELGYGDYYPKYSTKINYGQKYKVEFQTIVGNAYLKVDDVMLIRDERTTNMTANTNVMLFTHAISVQNNEVKTKAKVYYVKIWDKNGTLVRNFIPCYRKYDEMVGMYDIENNDFYTNNGTGTFLKGSNHDTPLD